MEEGGMGSVGCHSAYLPRSVSELHTYVSPTPQLQGPEAWAA